MELVSIVVRLVLAAIFGAAGLAKLADRAGFRQALRDFDVPGPLAGLVGVALPAVELGVAVALMLPRTGWWAAIAATALLLGFTAVVGRSLARGRAPDCNCFGRLSTGPVGRGTLVRNGILAGAGILVVVAGPSRAAPGVFGWLGALSPVQKAGLAGLVAALALLAFVAWLLVNLVRQNGRLLDQVAALEHLVGGGAGHRHELPLLPSRNGSNGHQHTDAAGLRVGDQAAALRLPDLDGNEVDLAGQWNGLTAVLIWNPSCGYCQQMLPELRTWEAERAADAPRLLVISTGSAQDNRAMGLTAPVLLDNEFEAGRAFGATGTPQAVLVDADGTIASPLVAGAAAVLNLVDTRLSRI